MKWVIEQERIAGCNRTILEFDRMRDDLVFPIFLYNASKLLIKFSYYPHFAMMTALEINEKAVHADVLHNNLNRVISVQFDSMAV